MTSLRHDPSIAYYEDQAQVFFDETVAVDMAPLHARFLAGIPPGGHLLDAGCGSGRDALAFRRLGYRVCAFEASPALARLASDHCGLPVEVQRFQDIEWEDQFDGIWACASLLHVPMAELPEVMGRLTRALVPGGLLYVSFKYGSGERLHGGRRFTDLDEAGLDALCAAVPGLTVIETGRGSGLPCNVGTRSRFRRDLEGEFNRCFGLGKLESELRFRWDEDISAISSDCLKPLHPAIRKRSRA